MPPTAHPSLRTNPRYYDLFQISNMQRVMIVLDAADQFRGAGHAQPVY